MEKGIIFNLQKFCIHDGPGIRTVIFFKGCLLNCKWCHNPESISIKKELGFNSNKCIQCLSCLKVCPLQCINFSKQIEILRNICNVCGKCVEVCSTDTLEIIGKEVSSEQIFAEAMKDIDYYKFSGGGITLSGGEPTLQPKFATKLLRDFKLANVHTALETCGEFPLKNIQELLNYVDLVLFDFKHINSEKHKKYTGVDNKNIKNNLENLTYKKNVIVRIPLIPDFNCTTLELQDIALYLKNICVKEVHLLPFNKLGISKSQKVNKEYTFKNASFLKPKQLNLFKEIFLNQKLKVKVED